MNTCSSPMGNKVHKPTAVVNTIHICKYADFAKVWIEQKQENQYTYVLLIPSV